MRQVEWDEEGQRQKFHDWYSTGYLNQYYLRSPFLSTRVDIAAPRSPRPMSIPLSESPPVLFASFGPGRTGEGAAARVTGIRTDMRRF